MLIKFKLQEVERDIHFNGFCYTAVDPTSAHGRALGYYSSLGGAVFCHIKHANIPEGSKHEEIIQLKDFVVRYEALVAEARGLTQEDLFKTATFVKKEKVGKKATILEPSDNPKVKRAIEFNAEDGELYEEEETDEIEEF